MKIYIHDTLNNRYMELRTPDAIGTPPESILSGAAADPCPSLAQRAALCLCAAAAAFWCLPCLASPANAATAAFMGGGIYGGSRLIEQAFTECMAQDIERFVQENGWSLFREVHNPEEGALCLRVRCVPLLRMRILAREKLGVSPDQEFH